MLSRLVLLAALVLIAFATSAQARPDVPGVCTWGNDPCGPLDIVCVTQATSETCLAVACNTQTQCTWPPQIDPCGDSQCE
ncbi:MAG: hypothetical protein QOE90_3752 [Thermoplasmata archaeon]|jgi:hypothetical protein|nr:hypothetical protein [Thermoplasmata archaeon]